MFLRERDRNFKLPYGVGRNNYMTDKQMDFIAQLSAQAGSDVIPLPVVGREGDYRLPTWDWRKLDWRKISKRVFNLQKRIYKATKAGQLRKAKKLSTASLSSFPQYFSIFKIHQLLPQKIKF